MPSNAQATQLPTFGAFKKFETHMQNRLPSSTETSYREEERDSRVFLKACDEPASQLNPDRDKIFNFPENKFFQQISQRSSSSGLFAFGNTAEAAKPPEMHHRKVPCFNPPCLLPDRDTIFTFPENKFFQQISQRSSSHGTFAFGSTAEAAKPPVMHHTQATCFNPHYLFGVGGNAEHPTDYEKAASLVRDTQLSIEDNLLRLQRERSNTWIAHLEGLGNDEEQFCRNSHISLERLNRITVMDRGAPELLKKLFSLLHVKDVTPLRLSQQYAAQELQPDKVFYVLGGCRCHFFFRVAATIFALQEDWLSVEIRICPASMLTHVSQVHAPLIFTSTCPTTETWLPHLSRSASAGPGLLYPRTNVSYRRYFRGHRRTRPMAHDHLLIVGVPSDCGG